MFIDLEAGNWRELRKIVIVSKMEWRKWSFGDGLGMRSVPWWIATLRVEMN